MPQRVNFDALLEVARGLLARPGRQVLAIAGAPGSGKSTLVEKLARALAGQPVAILPMDGFHYDDAVLHAMGRRPWKGAPDTFDVGGLRSALARLRDPDEGAVAVPVFDRDLEISRGSARIIGPETRLILAEGNYLLLDADPWRSLRPHFDATVMIEVPEAELRRRLRRRWTGYNLTEAEIDFKLDQNDLPNGRVVAQTAGSVDYILTKG
ncbi:nucleoside/nucleotide kinase family protein [Paracoccus lutimaris]|uniref:ArgK protein n=1 Tax=Paracoccus lutimaris TaxID=1490030 RepID=A0A368YNK2_9RHOB|nr:nucleoside/nucleotide kinase family protein [Paracoccus lutimaris]RCW80487.1 ArgK protein [Paracoccus lutimaris]